MKMKYQIIERYANASHAGTKAQLDVHQTMQKCGYEDLVIHGYQEKRSFLFRIIKNLCYSCNWPNIYIKMPYHGVLFWQGPNEYTNSIGRLTLSALQKIKSVQLICLLHDIDELRLEKSKYLERSNKQHRFVLRYADAIIVHNKEMKSYLVRQGIDEKKLIPLHIFDYLSDADIGNNAEFEKSITIAGNLDVSKAGYLKDIDKLPKITFRLYGPNFSLEENKNVTYHGKVHPDELPALLNKGFGLIWDGTSIHECSGKMGNYLRYNNPHKLSLYLASALPVVIWNQAAEADFVRNNNVGICVASLTEACERISNMEESEYNAYAENAQRIAKELRSGMYLSKAISAAEDILKMIH